MVSLGYTESPTATIVYLDGLTLLFSYQTIVAFREAVGEWVVSENIWSRTTGKHIMAETGVPPANRIPHEKFRAALDAVLTRNERMEA